MALAAIAFTGFILLGNWQLRRLSWKLDLIHDVNTRVHSAPVPAPGPDQWPRIKAGQRQYLHVKLTGRFMPDKQTLVHGTSPRGYGYWVMTPFMTSRGFIVLINRGYTPPGATDTPTDADIQTPTGKMALTGLLRLTEPGGTFLRDNRPRAGQWYSRDVAAIAKARDLPFARIAPYFVDADATANENNPPIAGLTKLHFRNHHLGYAITWYLLGLGTLFGAGLIVHHEWRARHSTSN